MGLIREGRVVTVRTPASSANLGPGFDALGLALSFYDELSVHVGGDALRIEVEGEGADDVPLTEDHLVVRSMDAAFDLMGVQRPGLTLACRNAIPHARGMGSSSAAIVGGIELARLLVDGGEELLDRRAAYQLANDIEGHPDNVAAAMFGGFTIAWVQGAAAEVVRLDVQRDLTVFVPTEPVLTEVARAALPATVSHRDAAANSGRAAFLVAALMSEPHALISGTEDFLHQSYRAEAMPASYALLRRLRVEGIPAVISGAGPTVLAMTGGVADRVPDGWVVHELTVSARGVHGV